MTSPATPQRVQRHGQSQSVSFSHARSPPSPATPYTPSSLRSYASDLSSTLTTPSSAPRNAKMFRNVPFSSPQVLRSYGQDAGFADLAQNWRTRAQENGISLAKGPVELSRFDDDESFYSANESSSFLAPDDSILSPPSVSAARRRALSQSQPPMHTQQQRGIPASPLARKSPSHTIMATPPPNRSLAQQLKLNGSLTAPAQPRRREAFGVVSNTPQQQTQPFDMRLDLFDIDEDDFEHEYDFNGQSTPPPGHHPLSHNQSLPLPLHPRYDDDYASYQLMNNVLPSHSLGSIFNQSPYADSYGPNASLDSKLNYYHTPTKQPQYQPYSQQYQVLPSPESAGHVSLSHSLSHQAEPEPEPKAESCSVCSRRNPPRLAVLVPCKHSLCSSCLTSALNIVGEKDMQCAVCKVAVADFKLTSATPSQPRQSADHDDHTGKSRNVFEPLFSSPGGPLESAFEFERSLFGGRTGVQSSTPPPSNRRRGQDNVVLRIDNVPWDITPPTITSWLQQPIVQSHVLLDKKGKTLSHAFVEVLSESIAASILRGEIQGSPNSGKKMRGSVLGKGKRARGVTVTRSSQEELMTALFPSWRGSFDGSQPSTAGLDEEQTRHALEQGMLTLSEVASLLFLIRSPDAHFLKVSSLPFYSLIAILNKLANASPALVDALFDAATTATRVLKARLDKEAHTADLNGALLQDLVDAGARCKVFKQKQKNYFSQLSTSSNQANVAGSLCTDDGDIEDGDESDDRDFRTPSVVTAPSSNRGSPSPNQVRDLAREFGVEAHLVEALAQRLAGTNLR
ncbi:hypothetical protein CYLTODRAFT_451322 [Cylindrobasidium torrendii FP15055 ss-10]|uniref:RING-type domain-containing protein n=1 Tax=Cylindrobasidium torrendii FP15055 ss-10 TaxID=1314674 RepID=A0A0D7BMK3_9AGAR|nr:hypothetical protein CYLTODRAFT_451322 [Cylindrobasidium torrendii FP15055 ss-10]